jgi:hypothetical protein
MDVSCLLRTRTVAVEPHNPLVRQLAGCFIKPSLLSWPSHLLAIPVKRMRKLDVPSPRLINRRAQDKVKSIHFAGAPFWVDRRPSERMSYHIYRVLCKIREHALVRQLCHVVNPSPLTGISHMIVKSSPSTGPAVTNVQYGLEICRWPSVSFSSAGEPSRRPKTDKGPTVKILMSTVDTQSIVIRR